MAFSNGKISKIEPSSILSDSQSGCHHNQKNNDDANGERKNPVGSSKYKKPKYRKLKSLKFMYEISKSGELRNVKSKKVLKGDTHSGYVRIQVKHRGKRVLLHHLVLEAWGSDKPSELHETDHIDRNLLNNHIDNLRWVTKSENLKNRDFTNITPPRHDLKTTIIDTYTSEVSTFDSIKDAASSINASTGGLQYAAEDSERLFKRRWKVIIDR